MRGPLHKCPPALSQGFAVLLCCYMSPRLLDGKSFPEKEQLCTQKAEREDEWMGGCMDGWKNGWMCGCVDGWVDAWTDGRVDGWVDVWMDGRMD